MHLSLSLLCLFLSTTACCLIRISDRLLCIPAGAVTLLIPPSFAPLACLSASRRVGSGSSSSSCSLSTSKHSGLFPLALSNTNLPSLAIRHLPFPWAASCTHSSAYPPPTSHLPPPICCCCGCCNSLFSTPKGSTLHPVVPFASLCVSPPLAPPPPPCPLCPPPVNPRCACSFASSPLLANNACVRRGCITWLAPIKRAATLAAHPALPRVVPPHFRSAFSLPSLFHSPLVLLPSSCAHFPFPLSSLLGRLVHLVHLCTLRLASCSHKRALCTFASQLASTLPPTLLGFANPFTTISHHHHPHSPPDHQDRIHIRIRIYIHIRPFLLLPYPPRSPLCSFSYTIVLLVLTDVPFQPRLLHPRTHPRNLIGLL